LIRDTYHRAGLSMASTRFFESHGTGTAVGDPREAQAIGVAFASTDLFGSALRVSCCHLHCNSKLAVDW
jgi:acyl transferase domain-containing protein